MRQWNHSGFSVYNEVKIEENHSEELENLAQYIVHFTFFADKLKYNEDTGTVIYKSRMHLGKKRNFDVLDAIEFLHRICIHIPDPYESPIRSMLLIHLYINYLIISTNFFNISLE